MNIDIRKRLRADRVDKICRALDGDDPTALSDDFGKIDSRIARPGADIEHMTSGFNPSVLPTFQNHRTPGAMLHAESLKFVLVCAKDVIAFFRGSHLAERTYMPARCSPPDSCSSRSPTRNARAFTSSLPLCRSCPERRR